MQWSHALVIVVALVAGLIIGVKAPGAVSRFSGGLIAA